MSSIPNAEDLYQTLLNQLKEQKKISPDFQLAGLASGGAWVAERLAKDLGLSAHGVINVSFHRDDYAEKGIKALNSSEGMSTKLPFEVEGAHIILVDDVLDTAHDEFRGKIGSWKKAVNAAYLFSGAGLPLRIAHSVTPENLVRLPEMVDLSYKLGAASIVCGRVMPSGRAFLNEDVLLCALFYSDHLGQVKVLKLS